ncbi:unnamed protein product [Sphenostylis stenocarpa]|uniref:Uncharacterized protein n=1 Tax=Sphenostylis stenocarpa TaxID=92480 RepID=A0AA86VX89_9FABA|nr:unnamed protein product [Sphenostylis stenocarpa]
MTLISPYQISMVLLHTGNFNGVANVIVFPRRSGIRYRHPFGQEPREVTVMLRFRLEFEHVGCSRGMAVAQYEEKQEQPDYYNKRRVKGGHDVVERGGFWGGKRKKHGLIYATELPRQCSFNALPQLISPLGWGMPLELSALACPSNASFIMHAMHFPISFFFSMSPLNFWLYCGNFSMPNAGFNLSIGLFKSSSKQQEFFHPRPPGHARQQNNAKGQFITKGYSSMVLLLWYVRM